ncbi:MAG: tannase/feruloyl esterase family alpha/beta hydrolase [Steroidobacteraceae bacterium]
MTLTHLHWIPKAVPAAVSIALLAGCAGGVDEPAKTAVAVVTAERCAALTSTNLPGVRITDAKWVPAGTERPRAGNAEVGNPLPEHCVVQGRIDERVGTDGKPYYTGFELRLPSAWSHRFLYQGGGGNDGIIRPAYGNNSGARGAQDNALQRGYAAVTTDAGHQGGEPLFGLENQARIDHAYNAHDRTAVTAKAIVADYYGNRPDKSYFIGCSGGGRQGMMFSQRFPDYFDGIIAIAPAMRVASGASIAAAWTTQRFNSVAPMGADGQRILSQSFTPADLKVVANKVLEKCDALDGLKDGLVQDSNCRINPEELKCNAGNAGACLKPEQADALAAMMAGPRNSAGESLYFRWPWDPGITGAGWRAWTLGTSTTGTPNSIHAALISGAVGYEFATPADPSLNMLNFNFDRDPARLKAFAAIYNAADDVDLAGYRKHGGKLLVIHGLADPIFSAAESMDYIQRVKTKHGAKADDFARLFLVPGMNHCAGGPAADAFDGLGAIERWVEKGDAPTRIEASGTTEMPGISRPLCAYPKMARYKGGDEKLASSFECR